MIMPRVENIIFCLKTPPSTAAKWNPEFRDGGTRSLNSGRTKHNNHI